MGLAGRLRGDGCVVEAEFRRRSGRGVEEWFYLPPVLSIGREEGGGKGVEGLGEGGGKPVLLDDYPGVRSMGITDGELVGNTRGADAATSDGVEKSLSTFELGLTAKQRQDRDEVCAAVL